MTIHWCARVVETISIGCKKETAVRKCKSKKSSKNEATLSSTSDR